MMSTVATAPPVRRTYVQEVRCPGCGRIRELTDRHVRKVGDQITLCTLCRFPARRIAPTITDRRFWLRRYSDDDIALMAEALFGACDRAAIAAWRHRLNIPPPCSGENSNNNK